MKIVVPVDTNDKVYHSNPWTAPAYALYDVDIQEVLVEYNRYKTIANPWVDEDESMICDPMACSDGCSNAVKDDLNHLADHYIILEVINGFDFMVADTYCENIEKVLSHANIKIFQIPLFVHDPDSAIKNLLINLKYTTNMNNIKKITL